jgi:hypothetical protein
MIAFAREYREIPHREQPAEAAWHAPFLAVLPQVREQLRFAFRNMPPSERAEALSETITCRPASAPKPYRKRSPA